MCFEIGSLNLNILKPFTKSKLEITPVWLLTTDGINVKVMIKIIKVVKIECVFLIFCFVIVLSRRTDSNKIFHDSDRRDNQAL
jgi:hypothetical protein